MHVLAFGFQTVDAWIQTGGCAALLGILLACGLGLPVPEDLPLLISGALIANDKMHWVPAAICAWCGIIGGDMILYHFGKFYGLEITKVRFIGKHLTRERIERVEKMFEQYGIWVVAVGRLFAGVRGAMVVAAGATRYNLIKFLITDSLAAIVSGGTFMIVGHWLGSRLNEENSKHLERVVLIGMIVIAVGIVGWILWRNKSSIDKAERSMEMIRHSKPPFEPSAKSSAIDESDQSI